MKASRLISIVVGAGVVASVAVFSCGSPNSDSDTAKTTSSDTGGKDVTQPFTLAIAGASADFPAGALPAGAKAEIKAGTAPAEFTATGVSTASTAVELAAKDAAGAVLTSSQKPFTLQLDISTAAARADVEKTDANLCVLAMGSDGKMRKWPLAVLTVDAAAKKVKLLGTWFGVYQLLYCGDNFAGAPTVNADGSTVTEAATTTTAPSDTTQAKDASSTTAATGGTTTVPTTEASTTTMPAADPNCNALANDATPFYVNDAGAFVAGTGGTIADGKYHATEMIVYLGSPLQPGASIKETIEVSGGGTKLQIIYEDFGDPETRATFTLAPNGVDPHLTKTCSTRVDDVPGYTSYTADATTFTLFNSTFNFSLKYTKVP
jgi:hypothetical protein